MTQGTRYYLELRSPHEQVTLQALTPRTMVHWTELIRSGIAAAYGSAPGALTRTRTRTRTRTLTLTLTLTLT